MDKKYLPVGTVVSLNTNAKKIMVIGYFSVEYQNVVKIYDYVGCIYPEGLLLKNSLISFNHSDIKAVHALGYTDESYEILNNNLNGQQNSSENDMTTNSTFVNVKFDANGVVVYDEVSDVRKTPEIVNKNVDVQNPFKGQAPVSESVTQPVPTVNNHFKFDESGIVTEDNTVKENVKEIESNFRYKFDANGLVVAEESIETAEPIKKESGVAYTFSSDGVVLEETPLEMPNLKDEEKKTPQYKFDANGIVIGE